MRVDRISYEADSIRLTINQRSEIQKICSEYNCAFAAAVRTLVSKGLESLNKDRVESEPIKD